MSLTLLGVVNELHGHQEEEEQQKREELIQLESQKSSSSSSSQQPINSIESIDLPIKKENEQFTTVLLIIASSNRPEYLEKTLHYVMDYHPKYYLSLSLTLCFYFDFSSYLYLSLPHTLHFFKTYNDFYLILQHLELQFRY